MTEISLESVAARLRRLTPELETRQLSLTAVSPNETHVWLDFVYRSRRICSVHRTGGWFTDLTIGRAIPLSIYEVSSRMEAVDLLLDDPAEQEE